MKFSLRISFLICFLLSLATPTAAAQEEPPDAPLYIVQAGDSLWDIAQRFGLEMGELASANGITDASQLAEGEELIIPGLDVNGYLVTYNVPFGESLQSLSRRYQVPEDQLARINHLSSPTELFTGYNLIIPQDKAAPAMNGRVLLKPGQSLLELAILTGSNPWSLQANNQLKGNWNVPPGEVLFFPTGEEAEPGESTDSVGPGALPEAITAIRIDPAALLQGRTTLIEVSSDEALNLRGSLMDRELHFFSEGSGKYISLQGVHALAEPGIYPLEIGGQLEDGSSFAFSQRVNVRAVDYPFDRPLTVDPSTIDPSVTKPEDAQWTALAGPATPERLWNGGFQLPSPLPLDYCIETLDCWTSTYGNRRSYNGSPYNFFHTGLDIAGGEGTEIYAPEDGVIVFAGPLTVRGNATMIDHGWGIYSGYMHQSEIRVDVGDRVEAGQLIGIVGGTGRVEGPHLHWEVWAGGVQVDPAEWLERSFP